MMVLCDANAITDTVEEDQSFLVHHWMWNMGNTITEETTAIALNIQYTTNKIQNTT